MEKRQLNIFDVIIIGAGSGGCLAAKTVAEAGYKVCLIDRKKEQDIGDKVCGDAIGKHHFDTIGLAHPSGEELEQKIDEDPQVLGMAYGPMGVALVGADEYGDSVTRNIKSAQGKRDKTAVIPNVKT